MTMPDIGPSVRLRRLARELRAHRSAAGFSLDEASRRLGWSASKLSRIENGRTRPTPAIVSDLLELYGLSTADQAPLMTLARDARKRGWWTAYAGLFTGSYVALEDEAERICTWEVALVPGLLQTEGYARAVIRAGRPEASEEELERRVAARMGRQSLLSRRNGPSLHAVICEAALRRPVGGKEVMSDQLNTIVAHSRRLNVKVQALPFSTGVHPGMDGPFVTLGFPGPDPDVAYAEGAPGDVYLESSEDVARLQDRFLRISAAALGVEETRDFIREMVRNL